MTITDLVALLERIGKLPLADDERRSLMQAAIAEHDEAPTVPRITRTNRRYGELMDRIVAVLAEADGWLSGPEIGVLADIHRDRIASTLTRLYAAGRVERMDAEPSPERGRAAPGKTTIYVYRLKVSGKVSGLEAFNGK